MVLRQLAGLPGQVRQCPAKVNGVLAGTAGNFQYSLLAGKNLLQDFKYGALILFAGFGVRFHVLMVIDLDRDGANFTCEVLWVK